MRTARFSLPAPIAALLLSVAASSPLVAQAPLEPVLAPYPSTATPEPLPLDLDLGAPAAVFESPATASPPAEAIDTPEGDELDIEVQVEEEPKWYYPNYWFRLPGWDTAIELGINGSSGTSESMSVRTGGYVKRKSDSRKVDFSIYHNRTKAGGVETQNNAQMNFRHDWLMAKSPWTIYVQTQLYYDEFQAFDLNYNMNSGMGYRLVDEEWMQLTSRMGAGASREFGAANDEWVPEAQFGIDAEQHISETQKLTASIDYFPEWEEFGRYRMLTDIGWEVELAVPSNVSLKVAATNRYDSHPDGADPNNLNYSVLLLWKL